MFLPPHTHGVPSDGFSLGVLLYEISTGELPYPLHAWQDALATSNQDTVFYNKAEKAAEGMLRFKGMCLNHN